MNKRNCIPNSIRIHWSSEWTIKEFSIQNAKKKVEIEFRQSIFSSVGFQWMDESNNIPLWYWLDYFEESKTNFTVKWLFSLNVAICLAHQSVLKKFNSSKCVNRLNWWKFSKMNEPNWIWDKKRPGLTQNPGRRFFDSEFSVGNSFALNF